ncbi:hypothetical protein SBV1_2300032 [Verrucomicrobia bacterium]|nr:hypothetical protein SBV1_2300032 [Verrucomicrobiota bacterium]
MGVRTLGLHHVCEQPGLKAEECLRSARIAWSAEVARGGLFDGGVKPHPDQTVREGRRFAEA